MHFEGAAFGGKADLAKETSDGVVTSLDAAELDLEEEVVGV